MYIINDSKFNEKDLDELKEMLIKVIPSYQDQTSDPKTDFVKIAFLKKVLSTCMQIKTRSQMDMITEFLDIFSRHAE